VGLFSSPVSCLVINALGLCGKSSNWAVTLDGTRKKHRVATLFSSPVKRTWAQRMLCDLLHCKMGCWSLPSLWAQRMLCDLLHCKMDCWSFPSLWAQRMLCDLLHCKMDCWSLPSLCFASCHPQSQWSQPGRCSRPPADGPR
jgi:hypothetical protein